VVLAVLGVGWLRMTNDEARRKSATFGFVIGVSSFFRHSSFCHSSFPTGPGNAVAGLIDLGGRGHIWEAARAFLDHPVLGCGPDALGSSSRAIAPRTTARRWDTNATKARNECCICWRRRGWWPRGRAFLLAAQRCGLRAWRQAARTTALCCSPSSQAWLAQASSGCSGSPPRPAPFCS
jgi:hypothetical protein